jgi:intracellular sulfur oxidation DsrE/DsrF family protein
MKNVGLVALVVGIGSLWCVETGWAQAIREAKTGPIIEDFGPVYPVDVDMETRTDMVYRVVFEVSTSPGEKDVVNPSIETLARFLNMHGQAGVPVMNQELALVLHGNAGKDALRDDAYRARFGVDNPNRTLLEALGHAGVRIYLCGQTAMHRGYPNDELTAPVQMALSAMTALVTLQAEGYHLIAF